MSNTTKRPLIESYDDFRIFIRDMVDYLRATSSFSNRKFAEECGLKSHSYLLMVLAGRRSLATDAAYKIASGFKLSQSETEIFLLLTQFNQTKDPHLKKEILEKLVSKRSSGDSPTNVLDHLEFYAHWQNVVLYEYLSNEFESLDLSALALELDTDESDLVSSLELLKRLGLVEQQKDQYRKTMNSLETPKGIESLFIREFHRSMIQKALDTIDVLPPSHRNLSSLTLSMPIQQYPLVVEKISAFRREMNALLDSKSRNRKDLGVFQMNIQLFPVLSPIFTDED